MERTPDDMENDQEDDETTEGDGNPEEAEGVVHPEDLPGGENNPNG